MKRPLSLALALVASLLISSNLAEAARPSPAAFAISMTNVGAHGLLSDCPGSGGTILAEEARGGGGANLHASRSDLNVRFVNSGIAWRRDYPFAASGTFEGCYGVTLYSNGNLWLRFQKYQGVTQIGFLWHFEYYISATVRENFTLTSEYMPFPAWTGADVPATRVSGRFDVLHYLNVDGKLVYDYVSFTGGADNRPQFDFDITITRR